MTGSENVDSLLSARQVRDLMGVSLVTLSRWRSAGKGPPFIRLSAARVAYPVGAYRQWIQYETNKQEYVA